MQLKPQVSEHFPTDLSHATDEDYGIDRASRRANTFTRVQTLKCNSKSEALPCPHEILGVAWDVSERALRSAYRRLALENHPDKGGDPVRFQLIVTAYEALMNRLQGNADF